VTTPPVDAEAGAISGARAVAVPARWPLMFVAATPRHALSRLAGEFARTRFPAPMQRVLNRGFVRTFKVDAEEAEFPIEDYTSLQALFTRRLRLGARPLAEDPTAIVSPVDGALGACGTARDGRLLQVKGREYDVETLLGGGLRAQAFAAGTYATYYLSPRDYHRIHAPVAGQVVAARYLPGQLWPVNRRAVAHIDDLFARNERLVTFIGTAHGEVAVVAVGATMVGRVVVTYDDLTTNLRGAAQIEREYPNGPRLARGEELGRFEFGSTVVVVLPPGAGAFDERPAGTSVRMGQAVGQLGGTGA